MQLDKNWQSKCWQSVLYLLLRGRTRTATLTEAIALRSHGGIIICWVTSSSPPGQHAPCNLTVRPLYLCVNPLILTTHTCTPDYLTCVLSTQTLHWWRCNCARHTGLLGKHRQWPLVGSSVIACIINLKIFVICFDFKHVSVCTGTVPMCR